MLGSVTLTGDQFNNPNQFGYLDYISCSLFNWGSPTQLCENLAAWRQHQFTIPTGHVATPGVPANLTTAPASEAEAQATVDAISNQLVRDQQNIDSQVVLNAPYSWAGGVYETVADTANIAVGLPWTQIAIITGVVVGVIVLMTPSGRR